MSKILEIFTVLFGSFFSNGLGWLKARPVTIDDFTVEVTQESRERVLDMVLRGYATSITFTVKLIMTQKTIELLDKYGYFKCRGYQKFDELSDKDKLMLVEYTEIKTLYFGSRLKNEKGNKLRNKDKITEIVNQAIDELIVLFENTHKAELIEKAINRVNDRINVIIKDNNQQYSSGVVSVCTNRYKLDELLTINEKLESVAKLKEEHDAENAKLDAEIKEYEEKIAQLEKRKSERYIQTRDAMLGERLKDIPDEVQKELDMKVHYPTPSRGILF